MFTQNKNEGNPRAGPPPTIALKGLGMAQKTDQKKLLAEFDLVFLSKGPGEHGWIGQFYRCPLCGYYADRNKYDICECGNICIDVDYCRVSVSKTPESEIEVYNATKKIK
ncbi:hypothetical protein Cflav_PD4036 [Pedosphaera parvula Ellin514]|uniref:Uncharacterized protein n=2 Tax=Pedosphaera TaxID=1032526 RepID=B9XGU6_PEDPL|nr:hypothetical protein Cflav_PD4036 [Pedosphaera parvula Ellin514]